MSSVLADHAQRLNRPLLWVDFERYAAQVFAGQPADWHSNAHRYADTLGQAQRLVRSDVVAVAVLDAWLQTPAWQAAARASLADALALWNDEGPPQRFVAETLDALFHRVGTQAMLVMALPSPSQVLRRAGRQPPFDFDDLDDVGSALTAVLRSHCERKFAALVLRCDEAEGLSDDEREAAEPLLKSARYYGWGTALQLDAAPPGSAPDSTSGFDTVLLGHWPAAALEVSGIAHAAGGLGAGFWRDDAAAPPWQGMRYGEIPADAVPERVAERLALLHGAPR